MPHAFVIGAALIAAAILARAGWSQSTTTPFTTGIVVAACSATTPPYTTGQWTYATGTQAPVTLNPGGEICVSQ